MIYFKPRGGLCNRIRAIDSMLTLANRFQKKLIVLWVHNDKLNCSFNELFEPIQISNFEVIEFIDATEIQQLNFIEYHGEEKNIVQNFEAVFKNQKLDSYIFNRELVKIYASKSYTNIKELRKIDALFYTKTKSIIDGIIKKDTVYISSCYRICEKVGNYENFVPTQSIQKKVTEITKNFKTTIGLHIRRTDHKVSKKFSDLKLFYEVIENNLKKSPETTFFLATDCAETKTSIISDFGNKIITNDIESYSRDDEAAIIDAMVDLYCLSKTNRIYGSYHSTFSQVAADIGGIEEISVKKPVGYKNYFKDYLYHKLSMFKK